MIWLNHAGDSNMATRLKMARARSHTVGTTGWIVLGCSAFSVVAGAAYLRSERRIRVRRGQFLDTKDSAPGRLVSRVRLCPSWWVTRPTSATGRLVTDRVPEPGAERNTAEMAVTNGGAA